MQCELSVSEAERMLMKIKKIGKFHENAKFLANEIMSDLRTAERNLHALDDDEAEKMRKRIDSVRKETKGFGIL